MAVGFVCVWAGEGGAKVCAAPPAARWTEGQRGARRGGAREGKNTRRGLEALEEGGALAGGVLGAAPAAPRVALELLRHRVAHLRVRGAREGAGDEAGGEAARRAG